MPYAPPPQIMHNSSQDEVYNVCGQSALEKVGGWYELAMWTHSFGVNFKIGMVLDFFVRVT